MLASDKTLQTPDTKGVSYHDMLTDTPWAIRNRDLVVETHISYHLEFNEVILRFKAVPDWFSE